MGLDLRTEIEQYKTRIQGKGQREDHGHSEERLAITIYGVNTRIYRGKFH